MSIKEVKTFLKSLGMTKVSHRKIRDEIVFSGLYKSFLFLHCSKANSDYSDVYPAAREHVDLYKDAWTEAYERLRVTLDD